MQDAHAHCEALVRAADRDRYLAGLFAPAAVRRHLYALYAFASEVARVREAAREPLPGEIRLQWWSDALGGDARGEVAANPVAAALIDTIEQCALPKATSMRSTRRGRFSPLARRFSQAVGLRAPLPTLRSRPTQAPQPPRCRPGLPMV